MSKPTDYLQEVGEIVKALDNLGLEPVLVGGMALVVLGSRRVTRDFDFVIAKPGDRLKEMLEIFYGRGFELASRLNDEGDITSTIDNRNVASIRIRLDAPSSAFFLNPNTGLRIDLLFDFPVPAARLTESARKTRVRSHLISVASRKDLLHLKKLAHSSRSSPGDAQDIVFLKASQKKPRK